MNKENDIKYLHPFMMYWKIKIVFTTCDRYPDSAKEPLILLRRKRKINSYAKIVKKLEQYIKSLTPNSRDW